MGYYLDGCPQVVCSTMTSHGSQARDQAPLRACVSRVFPCWLFRPLRSASVHAAFSSTPMKVLATQRLLSLQSARSAADERASPRYLIDKTTICHRLTWERMPARIASLPRFGCEDGGTRRGSVRVRHPLRRHTGQRAWPDVAMGCGGTDARVP